MKKPGLVKNLGLFGAGAGIVLSPISIWLDMAQLASMGLPTYSWAALGLVTMLSGGGYTIYRQEREKQALARRVQGLVADRASLEIVHQRVFPMWWPERRWHRIGVQNTGEVLATNVEVKLLEMRPVSPLPENVLPARLIRKDGGTANCTVNPGSTEFFDVVSDESISSESDVIGFVTSRGPRTLALWTEPYPGQQFQLDPNVDYELVIVVTAANALKPDTRIFRLRHPEGNQLEFSLLGIEALSVR
ncbi:MAG: hypothetical protein IT307_13945 [Chloroflexi bacterium]|nr:hypothetical protein [Chloroflexota bacterium]